VLLNLWCFSHRRVISLTFKVNDYNIDRMRQLVLNGPDGKRVPMVGSVECPCGYPSIFPNPMADECSAPGRKLC
jgi:hypothetical protein